MRKEIPILFSTAMVQAILAGTKTMTRRTIKLQPDDGGLHHHGRLPMSLQDEIKGWYGTVDKTGESRDYKCPYGDVGDVLWVRETWAQFEYDGEYAYKTEFIERYVGWERDTPNKLHDIERVEKWRPSIFMPKEAARIWLEVTNVRVERVTDISAHDAVAEGILKHEELGRMRYKDYMADASGYGDPSIDYPTVGISKTSFATLWEKINGKESWDANPWVWVVEFKVLSTTGKPEIV